MAINALRFVENTQIKPLASRYKTFIILLFMHNRKGSGVNTCNYSAVCA